MLHFLRYGLLLLLALPLVGRSQALGNRRGAAPDSAAAIKRLFRQRRQGAGMGLAVGCGPVAPGGPVEAAAPAASASPLLMPPVAVAGLGPSCSLLAMFSSLRFSYKREQRALLLLARHRPLPGYVQRALSPVFASN